MSFKISDMDILHETLDFMDQCFFNYIKNGNPYFGTYMYVLHVIYKQRNKWEIYYTLNI